MKLKLPDLTYRTRKRLRAIGLTVGITAVLALVIWVCWVIWLGRFVVYSRDGVRLDFHWQTPGEAVSAVPPEELPINIIYDDGSEVVVDKVKPLERLSGYYVTVDMLLEDVAEVEQVIREQPKGTAVLLELKTASGNFLYDSDLPDASVSSRVDTDAVGALIDYLARADYYTIASVPAFPDRAFGLENTAYGLHHSSGRYLWADEDRNYWMDPTKNGTRSWLVSIASELRDLGFDEVVFTDFRFPDTADIIFEGDRLTALNETAQHLTYNLSTDSFCVSFVCNDPGFILPEGRTRLYRSDVEASMAQEVAAAAHISSMELNLVYLTEANDTRFDAFGVLRPLPTGMADLPAATTAPEPTETSEPAAPQTPDQPQEPQEPQVQPEGQPGEQPLQTPAG